MDTNIQLQLLSPQICRAHVPRQPTDARQTASFTGGQRVRPLSKAFRARQSPAALLDGAGGEHGAGDTVPEESTVPVTRCRQHAAGCKQPHRCHAAPRAAPRAPPRSSLASPPFLPSAPLSPFLHVINVLPSASAGGSR